MPTGEKAVRTRMAPGPTGPFHIGRSRAAVLNWLFARHHQGTFVLRIEDTDQERSKPEHLQSILDSLRWLGLNWDEGPEVGGPYEPYFQMGRLDTYQQAADQLLGSGHAYPCFCQPDELQELRRQAEAERRPFRYPGTCRNLSESEMAGRLEQGLKPVLRLAMPQTGTTEFDDLILGRISFDNSELDDWVIMRTNEIPTYNFAVVVDDLTMAISHVIRGQEHVPNTPRQLITYEFLGKQPPRFGHHPVVLGMEGGKLSARHGAAPLTAYADDGYLPEAVLNYIATIGASYDGEREIFTPEELIHVFDVSKIGKSGAAFSEDKLEWTNAVFIRALPLAEFVKRSLPFLQLRGLVSTPPTPEEEKYAASALKLEQERVKTLAETPDAVEFFFVEQLAYEPVLLVAKKSSPEEARKVLEASLARIDELKKFDHDSLEPAFRSLAEEVGLKTGVVFGTIRVAITGRTAAPPLFDTMAVLGRDRVRERLSKALDGLSSILTPAASREP